VQSCDISLAAVAGKRITTIEGIGSADRLHALQAAFLEEQAAQCGYCTSGIIMTAYALLAANAHPTEAEICAALDGNICRCGTHARILRAIKKAAAALP
jgi:nicotinate dehydrogenase subunit A